MAASLATLRPLFLQPSPRRARARPLTSPFLSPGSLLRLTRPSSLAKSFPLRLAPVSAFQSNWFKVVQTTLKVGKDGIEAGANLVPNTIPKPIARICVAAVAGAIIIFLLKSLLSTAFFVLAMMGLIYFVFIALNTDEGSRGSGSTISTDEETLEEARRIMEKYK